jgi:hypothetical protein
MLSPGAAGNRRYEVLRPKNPHLFVDSSYLLYAVGLLSQSRPDVAARLFKQNMTPVQLPSSGA